MKRSEIYLRASEDVLLGNGIHSAFSCNAIVFYELGFLPSCHPNSPLADEYKALYEMGDGLAENANVGDLWWADTHEEKTNRRVLMLCLAAAIAESEGD